MALYSNNIRWIQKSYSKLFRIILSKYKQRIDQKRFEKWCQRESESKVGALFSVIWKICENSGFIGWWWTNGQHSDLGNNFWSKFDSNVKRIYKISWVGYLGIFNTCTRPCIKAICWENKNHLYFRKIFIYNL